MPKSALCTFGRSPLSASIHRPIAAATPADTATLRQWWTRRRPASTTSPFRCSADGMTVLHFDCASSSGRAQHGSSYTGDGSSDSDSCKSDRADLTSVTRVQSAFARTLMIDEKEHSAWRRRGYEWCRSGRFFR